MFNTRDFKDSQTPGAFQDPQGFGCLFPQHFDMPMGGFGSPGLAGWPLTMPPVPAFPQAYPYETFPGFGVPGYPPLQPFELAPQPQFLPPVFEQPDVSIEINVMVTEKNVAELTEKIPFLRVLIDQGVLRVPSEALTPAAPRPVSTTHLEKRPEPPRGIQLPDNQGSAKRVFQTPVAAAQAAPPDQESHFTALKQEIEHILTEELKKSEPDNRPASLSFRRGESSVRSDSARGSNPLDSIGAKSLSRRLNSHVGDERSHASHAAPAPPASRFSFQQIEPGAYNQNTSYNSDFKSYVDRMRRLEPVLPPTETEKIGLFQCKNIRNFWNNTLDPRPCVFKSLLILKQPDAEGRTTVEVLDYSNKRIADAEYRHSDLDDDEAVDSDGDASQSSSNSGDA